MKADAIECDDKFCGTANNALRGDGCDNVRFVYKGSYYFGCTQVEGFENPICPTNLNGSATFDPSTDAFGECECSENRKRRDLEYRHETLLREAAARTTYQVVQGDTWTSIAAAENVDIDRLLRYNGLNARSAVPIYCLDNCIAPVVDTWIITAGLESVMPECACMQVGFPHVSDDMMNCVEKREASTPYGSQGTARFCPAARPAGFVVDDNADTYWEVSLEQGVPTELLVDFEILSEVMSVDITFKMEILPAALLEGVILALEDPVSGNFNDALYFVYDCEESTFAEDNEL